MATENPNEILIALPPSELQRKSPGGWPAFVATHSIGSNSTPKFLLAVPFREVEDKIRFVDASGNPSAHWLAASKQIAFDVDDPRWSVDSLRCTFTSDLTSMGFDAQSCNGAVLLFIVRLSGQSLLRHEMNLPPDVAQHLLGQSGADRARPHLDVRPIARALAEPLGRRLTDAAVAGRVAVRPVGERALMPLSANVAMQPGWVPSVNAFGEEDLADALAYWS